MTWCGKSPMVRLVTRIYEKGKKVAANLIQGLEQTRLKRDEKLGRWFVDIVHQQTAQ